MKNIVEVAKKLDLNHAWIIFISIILVSNLRFNIYFIKETHVSKPPASVLDPQRFAHVCKTSMIYSIRRRGAPVNTFCTRVTHSSR